MPDCSRGPQRPRSWLPSCLASIHIGFHCYLIFSLNFVGIFAHGPALPRLRQSSPWRHGSAGRPSTTSALAPAFRARSPDAGDLHSAFPDSSGSHFFAQAVPASSFNNQSQTNYKNDDNDAFELSELLPSGGLFPPGVSAQKLIQNSIDRFDAYGDYDYIDLNQPLLRPAAAVSSHKDHTWIWTRPEPNRRKDTSLTALKSLFRKEHHKGKVPGSVAYHQASLNAIPLSHFYQPSSPKPGLVGTVVDFFGGAPSKPLTHSYQELYPAQHHQANAKPGFADQILSLIGIKGSKLPSDKKYSYQTNFGGNSLDYEYGDYQEGLGLASFPPPPPPAHQLSIPQRVVKWFDGFKVTDSKKKSQLKATPAPDRNQNGIDYESYESGDDFNLILYDKPNSATPSSSRPASNVGQYDFGDVMSSIKNNETTVITFKKFLSAAAALSERSDSNPVFMMWTIPTTLFAILGLVYFAGAIVILAYKSTVASTSQASGAVLLATGAALIIPVIIAFVIVTVRASVQGQLNVNQVMRGDFKSSMRQDFDGVDFTMDALFGAASLLGIGWIVSVTI